MSEKGPITERYSAALTRAFSVVAALGALAMAEPAFAQSTEAPAETTEQSSQDRFEAEEQAIIADYAQYGVTDVKIETVSSPVQVKCPCVDIKVTLVLNGETETLYGGGLITLGIDTLSRAAIDARLGIDTSQENAAPVENNAEQRDPLTEAQKFIERFQENLESRQTGFKKSADNLYIDKDLKVKKTDNGALEISFGEGSYSVFIKMEGGKAVAVGYSEKGDFAVSSSNIPFNENTHTVAFGDYDGDGDFEMIIYDRPTPVVDDQGNPTGEYQVITTTWNFNSDGTTNINTMMSERANTYR